jgi:hypothetical protein
MHLPVLFFYFSFSTEASNSTPRGACASIPAPFQKGTRARIE